MSSIQIEQMSSQLNRNLDNLEAEKTTVFDRIFRDSEGNIVIAQAPNLPVLVGLTATLLQFIVPGGQLHTGLALIAFGALFTWAWQELFEGVNYFRRGLGLIALVGIIALNLSGL